MKRTIRQALESDLAFIFSTWLRSYKHDSPLTWMIHSDTFFKGHQAYLERLLSRPGIEALVSCNSEDPSHIFGWLVWEKPTLVHFVYVKRALRREGVASELLRKTGLPEDLHGCEISHFTNSAKNLMDLGVVRPTFNPYGGNDGTR